jgi:hypothetical protein
LFQYFPLISKAFINEENPKTKDMYKAVLIIATFFIWSAAISQGEQQVAQANELTYFGLDCSKLIVIGEAATADDIVNRFFIAWNTVVITEDKKYDFGKAFKKKEVHKDIAYVSQLNAQRDPSDVIAYGNQSISEDELVSHIKSYKVQGSGVGLVFVLENFNKLEEKGTMWVTFFDIESKQVLMAKHMTAKPGGFGMRNFWVRTVYDVLQDSGKQYKKWIK